MSAEAPGQPSQEAAGGCRRRPPGSWRKSATSSGLHARAAARFVKTAHRFDADIWVRKNGTIVSGRSIMGLMMLAAGAGAELEISAAGREADDAVRTLAHLVECKFDED